MDFGSEIIFTDLKFNDAGLIPVVVQQFDTKAVLMMAWMNRESLQRTLDTGETWFWSRSRQEFWHKGATSGHTQRVISIALDCDGDSLLLQVEQLGAACHTGDRTCFHNSVHGDK
jgi:phosphoribosyl-ATP pyrophosphohydrolase/phosphoribosyl-AMP cyclohydrolase